MGKSQELYKKAKNLIPGGTQLLSKRPEMFLPDLWPAYYKKVKGCEVWDLDGNKYIDMTYMAVGACILGYANEEVDKEVREVIEKGTISTLNSPEEVELAELLCKIHPWAKMVRYARMGGEAMAIAIRIARAKTDKDVILFCGYHGWHDWYLSTNLADNKALDGHLLPGLEPKGVPRCLKGTMIPFNYNDLDEFLRLFEEHKDKLAAVVMEPIREHYPEKGFLEKIREVTEKAGVLLVFDEVSAGWRLNLGGAHLKLGVAPDLAVFAKAMSNGYPMAAIIGKEEVMQSAQKTFISSTYWTERIGPAAALATIKNLEKNKVPEHLEKIGRKVQANWKHYAEKNNLNIEVGGIYPLSHFSFEYQNSLILKTLFTQLMLEKGFLATTAFYPSFAHKEEHLDRYFSAVDEVFKFISEAVREGNPEKHLKGPICHSGFKRLT